MKRGRKLSWWGWEYFTSTPEKNDGNNPIYLCQVPVEKDKNDQPVLCCEPLSYAGSTSNFKAHLEGRHREWFAKIKSEIAPKSPAKQPKLTDLVKVEPKSSEARPATQKERDELDQDLLGYVVDDLRGVSSVEGILLYSI